MKPRYLVIAVIMLAIGLGAGFWWGQRKATEIATAPTAATGKAPERKILYYRNPMGLPDTSPVPKKDPMGMDYVPVYEGDAPAVNTPADQVAISPDKVQKLGVRSEPAQLRTLDSVVRAAGQVQVDERRVYAVSPKFEGWVERLFVNATGQPVAKGQPLFEAYSPELVSAQREYAIAAQGVQDLKDAGPDAQSSMQRLAESSLTRLRNWDISDEQVRALRDRGETRRTLTFRSPVSGVVLEKKALQGMRFMPGEALYQIADLGSVWVIADIYERDIGAVTRGTKAKVSLAAYPADTFTGTVTYVYPTLKPETRTVPVRIELANSRDRLKPNMYAQVELATAGRGKVLTVPASAVIDSGTRQIVLVDLGEGRYRPREVRVGTRTGDQAEIIEGVKDGERVVVAANFLIDAESNLKSAIGSFGHADHASQAPSNDASGARANAATVGHQAQGKIEDIDPKAGTVSIAHGEVPPLKWPAMTMEFKVTTPALLANVKRGADVQFEFVERAPGEYVITRLSPSASRGNAAAATPAPSGHAGH